MTENKPVVAVFGAYDNENYGDDLMAHLFAQRLSEAGYRPRLWRGPEHGNQGRRLEIATDMATFVGGAAAVVVGGGVTLSNSNLHTYWNGLGALTEACEREGCPMVAISVGSNGTPDAIHPAVIRMLKSTALRAVSVRLECDEAWVRQFGKPARFIPDIVLTALPYRERSAIRDVLLCLAVGTWERPLLQWLVTKLTAKGLRVRAVSQFPDDHARAINFFRTPATHVRHEHTEQMSGLLRDADLVVATGLHVGIAALAGGAEFISYRGRGKTVTFMNECGLARQVIQAEGRFGKLCCFWKLWRLLDTFEPDPASCARLRDMQERAFDHYSFMLEHIAEAAR